MMASSMTTDEFNSVVDEILNILSSCASMINTECEECYVCMSEIKESQHHQTCDSCETAFHLTCMGFLSNDKLIDQRLIWICSCCGNSNIAHRIFDKVCIPSHYNRYEPLYSLEDEDYDCHEPIKTQRSRKSGKSKKRYVMKRRQGNVSADVEKDKNEMKTSKCKSSQPDPVAKKNLF